MQKSPTHQEGNILDLYATNKPGLVKSCNDIPGISDHHVVVIDSYLKAHTSKKPPRKVHIWKRAYWDQIHQDAEDFRDKFLNSCSDKDIVENHSSLLAFFQETLDKIPSKMTTSRTNLPWFTQDLKRSCKRKQRLYNRAKKTGKKEHKQKYKDAQKSVQSSLNKAHWEYINNMLCTSLEEGNSKPFFKYVRSKREDQVGVPPLKEKGVLHTSAEKRSEIAAKQFKSVFTDDKRDPFRDVRLHGPAYPPIEDLTIRDEGVEKLLANVNPSKVSGPDEVTCRLLKELSRELASVI